jgi:D-arabinose 1-dehydrogenase-like Zn-dependent alcohol dehydrogenase
MVKKLGTIHYIDSQSQNAVKELAKMGGAKVIFRTVPGGKAMTTVLGGLGVNGKLIIIGLLMSHFKCV